MENVDTLKKCGEEYLKSIDDIYQFVKNKIEEKGG